MRRTNGNERLYQRGQTWWVNCYGPHGERVQRSTGCRDREAAEVAAARIEREVTDPVHAARATVTIAHAAGWLLAATDTAVRTGRKSSATPGFYRTKLGHVVRVFGADRLLATLRPVDGDRYVEQRRGEGASDHTVAKELCKLRQLLVTAKRRDAFEGDIVAIVPRVAPAYEARSAALFPAQLQRLLAALPPDRAAWVAFVVGTGARKSEAFRAHPEDVALDVGAVRHRGTKTKKAAREVPIVLPWQRDLVAYALAHAEGGSERLFTPWANLLRDLAAACTRAKIPTVTPNDLRRTHSTWLRNAGISADLTAKLLGHTDATMVRRVYDKPTTGELGARMLREARAGVQPVQAVVQASPTEPEQIVTVGAPRKATARGGTCVGSLRLRCNTGVTVRGDSVGSSGTLGTPDPPISPVFSYARPDSNGRLSASKNEETSSVTSQNGVFCLMTSIPITTRQGLPVPPLPLPLPRTSPVTVQ